MFIKNKKINFGIKNANRKKMENILGVELKVGDVIEIEQQQIPEKSKVEVSCICDICNKEFKRKRSDVKTKTFCSNECKKKHMSLPENNPNPKKEKVKKSCDVCKKHFEIFRSKLKRQKNFFCSNDCYYKFRSQYYTKEKIYNFQNLSIRCDYCDSEFKAYKWYLDNNKHHFCNQQCYFKFRKENYKEFYYKHDLNNERKETKPEKEVREWLERNGCNFIQEKFVLDKYYADFYLPELNLIIEVYGDYWHCNPDVYDGINKIPNDNQMKSQKNDIKRTKDITDNGFKLRVIWESEVNDNLDLYMSNLLESVTTIR